MEHITPEQRERIISRNRRTHKAAAAVWIASRSPSVTHTVWSTAAIHAAHKPGNPGDVFASTGDGEWHLRWSKAA